MKVFVSGQLDETEEVRRVFGLIKSAGHTITHDWTSTDGYLSSSESKLANREESGRRAQADIQGVLDCDMYILLSDNKNAGKGMYVELGAALALQQSGKDIKVFVVGAMNHLTLFYLHPNVIHETSIESVLTHLK